MSKTNYSNLPPMPPARVPGNVVATLANGAVGFFILTLFITSVGLCILAGKWVYGLI